jgi:ABC-2 type transport system permease protein
VSAGGAIAQGGVAPTAAGRALDQRVFAAYQTEMLKLSSQLAVRLLVLVCAIGPFAFSALLKVQSGTPADALFGAYVHSSGFAVCLVVMGFAGSWGFPLIAGLVAGDQFASEDRHNTWKTILTRSCSLGELFTGKLLAAATFAVAMLLVALVSSLAAGLILVGGHGLVDLSGGLQS